MSNKNNINCLNIDKYYTDKNLNCQGHPDLSRYLKSDNIVATNSYKRHFSAKKYKFSFMWLAFIWQQNKLRLAGSGRLFTLTNLLCINTAAVGTTTYMLQATSIFIK